MACDPTELGGATLRLTIDLDALVRNWRRLADMAAPAECAAVVKADAYGIGIDEAVPALLAAGARIFFVALPHEGARVRAAAAQATIYVLNGFAREWALAYEAGDLRPVLNSMDNVRAWAEWRHGRHALSVPRHAALHVDTGMNRLGLRLEEALALAGDPLLEEAAIGLLMSHLACADEPDHPLNAGQLDRTCGLREILPQAPLSLANSGGIHLGRDYHFDLVRPGIALYGGTCHPGSESEPVVSAEARILQVRGARAGETVGYGAAQTLRRDSRLAILGAGYADGYLRSAGASDSCAGAQVWIAGARAPIVGRVSMDLIAADVTDIAPERVRPGDHAELFGPNIGIDEAAEAAGTIAYEVLTGLSRRAERRYVGGGRRD